MGWEEVLIRKIPYSTPHHHDGNGKYQKLYVSKRSEKSKKSSFCFSEFFDVFFSQHLHKK